MPLQAYPQPSDGVCDVGVQLGVAGAAHGNAVEALSFKQLRAVQLPHKQDLVHHGLQKLEQNVQQRVTAGGSRGHMGGSGATKPFNWCLGSPSSASARENAVPAKSN